MKLCEAERKIQVSVHSTEVWYALATGHTAGEDALAIFKTLMTPELREVFEMGIIVGWQLSDHGYSITDKKV